MDHIIYRNAGEWHIHVMVLTSAERQEITCVGTFSYIGEGERLEAEGTSIASIRRTGSSSRSKRTQLKPPEDEESVERYLGIRGDQGNRHGARGHGSCDSFMRDTFRIIEEEPERLAEIKGISERKAREIAQQIYEKRDMRKAMTVLAAVWCDVRHWPSRFLKNTGSGCTR